jgi:integrase
VLKQDWQWLEIIKAPKIQSLPDILTPREVERLIGAARKLRYRVFSLTTYTMGLRLGETLTLEVGDIDAETRRVHIRQGKGHKDRFVPLPDLTCNALRALWLRHRHPRLLFPNCNQTTLHNLLFVTAVSSLKDFGLNPKQLGADIGMTAVLHTHSRRFDYHPHLHVIVPGGGVNKATRQWKKPVVSSCSSKLLWPVSSGPVYWQRSRPQA